MDRDPTVFVVDDDSAMLDSLRWLIESLGLQVKTFNSAAAFLAAYDGADPGCLVLDVRMPGMSGLELQEELARRNVLLPIIIITAHGDVPTTVKALKRGAVDFIEKPFSDQVLLDRIQQAIEKDALLRVDQARLAEIEERVAALTKREREVMELVVQGNANKNIATMLGVSMKTVEAHRAKVMDKMKAGSVAELVRLAVAVGVTEPESSRQSS